ncbi:hypothetical protein M1P97_25845 [Parabacteroides sp. GYB001]|uniref:hypothetical protein n=1 Tax=Parabacteroides leei TaxID=2939491 RepID=UPI0020172324|nr:hypothetical protein [Parabacteroides leei]MCL3854714.1 hypothetical protein [Parabacteroides leei]
MKLTLKDRVLILNTVLPQFDTRKNMELKISIDRKIAISDSDQKRIVTQDIGNGQFNIGFTDSKAHTDEINIEITNNELEYLKQRVNYLDSIGMFSEYTLPTYIKIIEEPFIESNDKSIEK